jgi:hypothetical protein
MGYQNSQSNHKIVHPICPKCHKCTSGPFFSPRIMSICGANSVSPVKCRYTYVRREMLQKPAVGKGSIRHMLELRFLYKFRFMAPSSKNMSPRLEGALLLASNELQPCPHQATWSHDSTSFPDISAWLSRSDGIG